VAQNFKIVLREPVPPEQQPYIPQTLLVWQAQLQTGNPDLIKHAGKCTFQLYKMLTPNNSPVLVGKPTYDVKTVPAGYLYDCHTYAMGCYEKFGYLVQSGSLWDVYNDPQLATKIVHNEPEVIPAHTAQLKKSPYEEDKQGRPSIMNTPFPTPQGLKIESGDIMVFWTYFEMQPNWYLSGWHSVIIETPVYRAGDGGRQYLTLDTMVRSKDGSADPVVKSLDAVTKAYGSGYLKGTEPVGVYRLVCSLSLEAGQ
jgi:hypothetical protein